MDILIPYIATAADVRFFNHYEKGLKRERITRIVCNILKIVASVMLRPAALLVGLGLISLPIVAVLIAGGTLPLISLVAIPILLGVIIITAAMFGLKNACEDRANLATSRLREDNRGLIEKVDDLRRRLENSRFAGAHVLISLDSDALFYQRIGLISSDMRKQVKELNSLYFPRRRYRRINQEMRKRRVETSWDEMRVRMQNDLPSDLMLGELLK